MPRNGSQTLGDFSPDSWLVAFCDKCGRKGRYHVGRLMEERGPDLMLTYFKHEITADCPKHKSYSVYDTCGVMLRNVAAGRI